MLAEAAGADAERTIEQLCVAADVGEPLPPPTPAAVRMADWQQTQLDKTQSMVDIRPEHRSIRETMLLEMEDFENKLAVGSHRATAALDATTGDLALLPAAGGRLSEYEATAYDSDDDFIEPGGFDMDISTAAAAALSGDRPQSRLEMALTIDPR